MTLGPIQGMVQDSRNGNIEYNRNALITRAQLPDAVPISIGYAIAPLEQVLEENGFRLQKPVAAGSQALIFGDDKGDIIRIASDPHSILDSAISIRPAHEQQFVISHPAQSERSVTFSARIVPLAVKDWQNPTDNKEKHSIGADDILTVAAILHHFHQLRCWVDISLDTDDRTLEEAVKFCARDKLLYLPDGKGNILRFSNGKPIPFLADINSLTDDERAVEAYSKGEGENNHSARNFLKQAFQCADDAALDTLLEKRFNELPEDWERSLAQQQTLLAAIRQRHGIAEPEKGWADERPAGRPGPASERNVALRATHATRR